MGRFGKETTMAVSITAIYEDGVFRPLEELDLPEHQKFRLIIQPAPDGEPAAPEQETLADVLGFDPSDEEKLRELAERQREAWLKMAGTFAGDRHDVSRRHDYYIYVEPSEKSTNERS